MKTPLHKLGRKLRAGAYARVSTDNQKEEQTIETQDDVLADFLKENDEHFELIPAEPGATLNEPLKAFYRDNPYNLEEWSEDTALAKLFKRIEDGEIDTILITKQHRLFRSQHREILGKIQDFLHEYRVRVFSVADGELEEGFIRDVHAALGTENKKSTVETLHNAKRSFCKREGRPPNGKSPYGHAWDDMYCKWNAEKDEFAILNWAAGLATGKLMDDMPISIKQAVAANPNGLSAPKIADALNDAGLNVLQYYRRNKFKKLMEKNPKGLFTTSFITTIFRKERENLYVHGKLLYSFKDNEFLSRKVRGEQKRETITVNVLPAIAAELWRELQAHLYKRRKSVGRHPRQKYLLHRLLHCSNCGIKLGSIAKHKKYKRTDGTYSYYPPSLYYKCERKVHSDGSQCQDSNYHNAPVLEAVVWDEIERILTNPTPISDLHRVSHMSVTSEPTLSDLRQERDQIDAEIAKLDEKIRRNGQAYLDGVFTAEEHKTHKLEIEGNRKKLEKKKRDIEAKALLRRKIEAGLPPIELEAFADKFRHRLDRLDFDEKRLILKTLVDRIVIAPDSTAKILLRPIQRKAAVKAS